MRVAPEGWAVTEPSDMENPEQRSPLVHIDEQCENSEEQAAVAGNGHSDTSQVLGLASANGHSAGKAAADPVSGGESRQVQPDTQHVGSANGQHPVTKLEKHAHKKSEGNTQSSKRGSVNSSTTSSIQPREKKTGMIKRSATKIEISRSSHFEAWMLAQSSQDLNRIRRFFGIHEGMIGGSGKSSLIHPLSPFSLFMLSVSGLLIAYGMIMAPYQLAFFWSAEPCNSQYEPLIIMDMISELFFTMEMILGFFTGAYTNKGEYMDSFHKVAFVYLKSMFALDLVTSLPLSWLEYFAQRAACQSGDSDVSEASDIGWLKVPLRAARPLRIVKMLKALKILKLIRMKQVGSSASALSGKLELHWAFWRFALITFALFLLCHYMSCFWWLLKETLMSEEEMAAFLETHQIEPNSPNSKLGLSLYFISTVFSSVGFGDISGFETNDVERFFITTLNWCGVFVSALIISEVQRTISEATEQSRNRDSWVNNLTSLLSHINCDPKLKHDLIHWAKSSHLINYEDRQIRALLKEAPPALKCRLASQFNLSIIHDQPVIQKINSDMVDNFVADLVEETDSILLQKGDSIKGTRLEDMFFMVRTGSLQVTNATNTTLMPGDFFGEFAFIHDPRFDSEEVEFKAERSTEIQTLKRAAFPKVLARFPESFKRKFHLAMLSHQRGLAFEASGIVSDEATARALKTMFGQPAPFKGCLAEVQISRWNMTVKHLLSKPQARRTSGLWETLETQIESHDEEEESPRGAARVGRTTKVCSSAPGDEEGNGEFHNRSRGHSPNQPFSPSIAPLPPTPINDSAIHTFGPSPAHDDEGTWRMVMEMLAQRDKQVERIVKESTRPLEEMLKEMRTEIRSLKRSASQHPASVPSSNRSEETIVSGNNQPATLQLSPSADP